MKLLEIIRLIIANKDSIVEIIDFIRSLIKEFQDAGRVTISSTGASKADEFLAEFKSVLEKE